MTNEISLKVGDLLKSADGYKARVARITAKGRIKYVHTALDGTESLVPALVSESELRRRYPLVG